MNLTKLKHHLNYIAENPDLSYLELDLLFTSSIETIEQLVSNYEVLKYKFETLSAKYKYITENNGEYPF